MATLDMDALTEAQRDTLGLIATGLDGGHNPRTLAVLARLGLIVGRKATTPVSMGAATASSRRPLDGVSDLPSVRHPGV
jgi:hypothetical protein